MAVGVNGNSMMKQFGVWLNTTGTVDRRRDKRDEKTSQTKNGLYRIGELDNLTTKIITLLEFFNFVSEVLVCSTSDQVTGDAFVNHLG
jgi:hypothetical protein